ncbi:sensor histidine kinase [Limoniibacter endophyticus]|uniref:histidine kinase n=1 Tax=Limoniibacter endophyticus TaxID=1565040 RepID=A0A8J3DGE1_9HYPH|nr:HAMP domain-containing sensor histidine kinase [Limoniibacter endophyticus]GHC67402.1 ATPase [Limoniibacter endophyticus]
MEQAQHSRDDEGGRGVIPRPAAGRIVPRARSLSTKLLWLTALFVLLAEILIFIPSIADFRLRWLEERLSAASTVGVVLSQDESADLSQAVQNEVLRGLGVKAVGLRDGEASRLLIMANEPPTVDLHVELDAISPLESVWQALSTLAVKKENIIHVTGHIGDSAIGYEIVVADAKLRKAMLVYSRNVALLSLAISLFTAVLVFSVINKLMIRPIRTMTRSMLDFAESPSDPTTVLSPDPDRGDELGVAHEELAKMQKRLQRTLGEQKHLADLGLAVSKINHDMRNVLASAQLWSDRLASVRDPAVQSFAPKLVRTLDRAVSYSESVLAYGAAREDEPVRFRLRLSVLVDELEAMLEPSRSDIEFINAVPGDLEVDADADQLFRVLNNLARNAIEAMGTSEEKSVVRRIEIGASRDGGLCRIHVSDTGPGLPQKARDNLFAAFRGSARSGGTGLGLAIAHELVTAHGGTIELVESRSGYTHFMLSIPDRPVNLASARKRMGRGEG